MTASPHLRAVGTPEPTLPRRFRQWALERGDATLLRQKQLGVWRACTWREAARAVDEIAAGLAGLGVQPGEAVGLLAGTCKDWVLADLGLQSAGAVVLALHTSEPAPALRALCREAGVRVLFVENEELLDKLLDGGAGAGLEHIVVFHMEGLHAHGDARLLALDTLQRRGAQALAADPALVEQRLAARAAGDVATIACTAGRGGRPKAVSLTHANLLAAAEAVHAALTDAARAGGERLLFMPLSHVMERVGEAYVSLMQGAVMNFAESPDTVFDNLREVQPDVLMAVPRVWERLHATLAAALAEATPLQRWAYQRALAVGQQVAETRERGAVPPATLRLRHRLARALVLGKLRRMMGLDRVRLGVSAAAPIAPALVRWYRAMGVDLRQAWGVTEAGGAATLTGPGALHGSVGRPLRKVQLRVAEDGEILLRGPMVSAAAAAADGWLHTGDLGRIDEAGELVIAGRREELLVSAAGVAIAPAEIELRLKASPCVREAVVVGDGRPWLGCLVVLEPEALLQWAQERQLPFSDLRSLCASREAVDLIAQAVEQANRGAPAGRHVKAFHLVDPALDADDEAFTPTLGLKRRRLVERHAQVIEGFYRDRARAA